MVNVDNILYSNNTLTLGSLESNIWIWIFLKTKQNNM